MPSLDENKVDCLCYLEQMFFETGSIPSDEKMSDVLGIPLTTIQGYWKNEKFRAAVLARGVSPQALGEEVKTLTLQQLDVVARIVNTYDKSTMREKLKDAGVTSNTLRNWMRDDRFKAYLELRVDQAYGDTKPEAKLALIKNIQAGDLSSIKFMMELSGEYNPKLQVDVNVNVLLPRLIEIVSKHVVDPTILGRIADDIDVMMGVEPQRPMLGDGTMHDAEEKLEMIQPILDTTAVDTTEYEEKVFSF